MERLVSFMRRNAYLMTAALLVVVFFSACKKETSYERTPAAGLMAFNLAPDQNAVGITLSGNVLTNTPLNYTSFTGSYLPIYIGSRNLTAVDYYSGTQLATTTQVFADSMYYSSFTVGDSGNYKNVVVNDKLDSLVATPNQAFVRYINAIPDSTSSPLVTFSSNGSNVISNNAAFASISGFTQISAGNITVGVNNGGTIAANRTIAVDAGKVYTILLVGKPGATDSTKTVQIKFIQNGTVTK